MYVPNLIPERSRVEVDFEFKAVGPSSRNGKLWKILSSVGAVIFLIEALVTILTEFWVGLICLIVGLVLLPHVHAWIEKSLQFKFTWIIKGGFLVILFSVLIPISQHYAAYYHDIEIKEHAERARIADLEERRKIAAEHKERERLDSLAYYTKKADEKIKASQFRSAIPFINTAIRFSNSPSDLIQRRGECFYHSNQFTHAIDEFSSLINSSYNPGQNYYYRALCYQRTNQKGEAISDLKQAVEHGNLKAKPLYEKLNPLKRRIIGYVTRCCDGSTSNAKGRGACSHHRGVCNWNDPIYQEYRDY